MISRAAVPVLDLVPAKAWRRFVPLWLRSPIWMSSDLSIEVLIFLAVLLAFTGASARAATIRDGDNFSITIESPDACVCIFFPESDRDPVDCAGLNMPASMRSDPSRRDLAIGLIRFGDIRPRRLERYPTAIPRTSDLFTWLGLRTDSTLSS